MPCHGALQFDDVFPGLTLASLFSIIEDRLPLFFKRLVTPFFFFFLHVDGLSQVFSHSPWKILGFSGPPNGPTANVPPTCCISDRKRPNLRTGIFSIKTDQVALIFFFFWFDRSPSTPPPLFFPPTTNLNRQPPRHLLPTAQSASASSFVPPTFLLPP